MPGIYDKLRQYLKRPDLLRKVKRPGLEPGSEVPAFRAKQSSGQAIPEGPVRRGKTTVMSGEEAKLAQRDAVAPNPRNASYERGGVPVYAPTARGKAPANPAAEQKDVMEMSDEELQKYRSENLKKHRRQIHPAPKGQKTYL